jgi:hypothetical protein
VHYSPVLVELSFRTIDSTEEFAAEIREMRHEQVVSVELDGAHVPARSHLQALTPDPVDRSTDNGQTASIISV